MNKLTLILGAIVMTAGAWFMGQGHGYAKGMAQGQLTEAAKRDSSLVAKLTETIDASAKLATSANTASEQLRQSVSAFETQYHPVIKEFNDALTESASSRTGCVFSPGVMRQLQAAQQRAATAARQGLPSSGAAAVPGPAASARKPR